MIEIIKEGVKPEITCTYCTCRFSYDEEDTHTDKTYWPIKKHYVICPTCKKRVYI